MKQGRIKRGELIVGRKLFCELSPTCYRISLEKEIIKRKISDLFGGEKFAERKSTDKLPAVLASHSSVLIRHLEGVDMRLQENKVTNIRLACEKINGIVVRPGEVFSFWRLLGKPTEKAGYLEGMILKKGKPAAGIGGGLCQMANMVHYLVLYCALQVTELHHHTDALFPDDRRRVPFGTGTSVSYNNLDYRFRNNSDGNIQIFVWIENGELCGEIRGEKEYPYTFSLEEEDHHFSKEGDKYYRISKVYRVKTDKESGRVLYRENILNNHSEVMYDYALIPKEQIR